MSLGVSVLALAAAIALALAPQAARLARASALSVRAAGYVAAARTIGCSPARVLLKHVLPHSLGPVLVYATGFVATALAAEAALSYLGLGAPPPTPSWGNMLQEGREFLETAPWLTLAPAIALATTATAFALLGDALSAPRTLRNPKNVVHAQAGTSPSATRTPEELTLPLQESVIPSEGRNRRGGATEVEDKWTSIFK